jgi:hypothetical protein
MTSTVWLLMLPLVLPLIAPAVLARRFRGIEKILRWASRRPYLSAAMLTIASLALGPLLAQFGQRPYASIHDEFSYLLAADTYAHGRLTNPPHPFWKHFESMHILVQPTYASKYPPAQGLILALGQVVFRMAIVGVWLNHALATLAAIWMLRGWMPYRWAFLGGFLLASHPLMIAWGQSYWGGGAAVLGGCLVVGAWPRVARKPAPGAAFLGALGLAILANSRPYEGLVLALTIGACQAYAWLRARPAGVFYRMLAVIGPVIAVMLPTIAGMAFLNDRVTGQATRMPYMEHQQQYATVPTFLFMPPRPAPEYRHDELRKMAEWEVESYEQQRTFLGFLRGCSSKVRIYFDGAFQTPLLLLSLLALPWVLRQTRYRAPAIVLAIFTLALLPETYAQMHYGAPVAGIVNLLCVQGLRQVRCLRWPQPSVGRSLVRLALILSLVSTALFVAQMEKGLADDWSVTRRLAFEKSLQAVRGKKWLVFVRYGKEHDVHQEWVYNGADIDHAQIVWARSMGEKADAELKRYFPDRIPLLLVIDAVPNGTRRVDY